MVNIADEQFAYELNFISTLWIAYVSYNLFQSEKYRQMSSSFSNVLSSIPLWTTVGELTSPELQGVPSGRIYD